MENNTNSNDLRIQSPSKGKFITILSIDGGGVRGMIPQVILAYLESQLQTLDGEDARLADYFDVIAGTSIGALLTTMITAPDSNKRPLYAAKELVPYCLENCSKMFPKTGGPFAGVINVFKAIKGPSYDGKFLRGLLKDMLGETRLHQTLTNVVVPAFDIKKLQPVIFSSLTAPKDSKMDVLLADICLGTSAAPTYFPAHYFENKGAKFNLIDGGVVANNPALIAIMEMMREVKKQKALNNAITEIIREGNMINKKRRNKKKNNSGFVAMKPMDMDRFLVISIGTGSAKNEEKYDAEKASKWGILGWLYNNKSTPLIDSFSEASNDMVEYHTSVMFEAFHSSHNYLRIQDDTLTGDLTVIDLATKSNLENLVKVGEQLLKKPISRVNFETGCCEPIDNKTTNMEALKKFAKLLSNERKLRRSNMS